MSIHHEVIAGTKTEIYCRGTKFRRCVLAALRTVKLGLTEYGTQTKPLKYSEKKSCISYQYKQMFKRTPADLDSQSTTQQQRLPCALKNARLKLSQR